MLSFLFITADHYNLSFNLPLPSLVNKAPRYLSPPQAAACPWPAQTGHSTLFWLRTITSDLEVLIFLPVALHSPVNRRSASWRLARGLENHVICKM